MRFLKGTALVALMVTGLWIAVAWLLEQPGYHYEENACRW
jgi:hypothetical protein